MGKGKREREKRKALPEKIMINTPPPLRVERKSIRKDRLNRQRAAFRAYRQLPEETKRALIAAAKETTPKENDE